MSNNTNKNERDVDELYGCLEGLPSKLDKILETYNTLWDYEKKRNIDEISAINRKCADSINRSRREYEEGMRIKDDICTQRGNEIEKMVYDEEGKALAAELQKACDDIDLLKKKCEQMDKVHSVTKKKKGGLFKDKKGKFAGIRDQLFDEQKEVWKSFQNDENAAIKLCEDEISRIENLIRIYKDLRNSELSDYKAEEEDKIEKRKKEKDQRAVRTKEEAIEKEKNKHLAKLDELHEQTKARIDDLAVDDLKKKYDSVLDRIPSFNNYETVTEMPSALGKGTFFYDLSPYFIEDDNCVMEYICEIFGFLLTNLDGKKGLKIPYGNGFRDDFLNQLIVYDDKSRSMAIDYTAALELRMFMSIPCGKLYVTMIDPVGTGKSFSMFSSLGDYDERVISKRILCTEDRIEERLQELTEHIAYVHQSCLRGEYRHIVDYNKKVQKNAEPLQALFIADFPKAFSERSCEMLEQLISSGPECGIFTFVSGNKASIDDGYLNMKGKAIYARQIEFLQNKAFCMIFEKKYTYNPLNLPDKESIRDTFDTLERGIKGAGRVIINFDEICDGLLQHKERWFQFDSSTGLEIPIGLDSGRVVKMHLGGEDTTKHHALITGTTGSGKSKALHTIIMGMLLRYSPKDVQIYLLDFKRGIESSIYADVKLPNFRVISLDTEPEFGLSVLNYLENLQADRAQGFRESEVSYIEGYNGKDDQHNHVSRVVLIIDEFQEMFADMESSVSKECAKKLQQILKQGRGFGVHVIMATQSLPDAGINYDQIMNRLVLQSTREAAEKMLNPDNPAIDIIQGYEAGQGVFNDAAGNRDSNHIVRTALLEEKIQKTLLNEIKEHQKELYGEWGEHNKPRLLLSSIQDDEDNQLNRYAVYGEIPKKRELGYQLYLGESIDLIDECNINIKARRAQNLLIVGRGSRQASQLYGFASLSILFDAIIKEGNNRLPEKPIISFFDFQNERTGNGNGNGIIDHLCRECPSAFRIFGKDSLVDGLEKIKEEIDNKESIEERHFVIFAGLNRARRILSPDNAYSMPLKKLFESAVINGPEKGYNFIVWANEPSTFCEFYGGIISEFDYRLMYDLEDSEYKQLLLSAEHISMSENNALLYDVDRGMQKIRIYMSPMEKWFNSFVGRIKDNNKNLFEEGEFQD